MLKISEFDDAIIHIEQKAYNSAIILLRAMKHDAESKVIRLGFDYHGVIDKYPELFGTLSRIVMASGGQVYIVSGHRATPEFALSLEQLGIEYTEILSVIDFNERNGVPVKYDEKGDPWIDGELWNSTKADLCKRYDIDLHVDDSEVYGKYFTEKTKYLLLK